MSASGCRKSLCRWEVAENIPFNDYLELLDSLGERSNALTIWVDIALAASVLLIFFNASAGLMLLTVMLCVNITTYLKEKRRVESRILCMHFKYVLRRCGRERAGCAAG